MLALIQILIGLTDKIVLLYDELFKSSFAVFIQRKLNKLDRLLFLSECPLTVLLFADFVILGILAEQ